MARPLVVSSRSTSQRRRIALQRVDRPPQPTLVQRDVADDPWADDPDHYRDQDAESPPRDRPRRAPQTRTVKSAKTVQRLVRQRWGRSGLVTRRWIPWVAGGSLLLLSDWQLGSAAAAGGAVVWLVYRSEPRHWQAIDRQLQGWFRALNRGENGKLAIAVAGGGVAMLSAYVAAAVLGESTGWLGAATVLQGLGTLGAIALLVRHWLGQPAIDHDRLFHRAIDRLSDRDPLAQLAATRQLEHLADRGHLNHKQQRTAADCVRLLLAQGCDRPVREAAWDTLALLEPVGADGESSGRSGGSSRRPMPVNLPRSSWAVRDDRR
ncbi:MAG: hypothetical protein EA001_01510 [Oscillatoriales cyanobacterium]|nr:MAG: hypothetical protein EA001_01510 [Oscillatoriales cyanobacterium]